MKKLIRVLMIVTFLLAGVITIGPSDVGADPYVPPVLPAEPWFYPEMRLQTFTPPDGRMTVAASITDTTVFTTAPTIDMRILVVHGKGFTDTNASPITEHPYNMVKSFLDVVGIPYDSVDLSASETVSEADLWDGVSHGNYYAIFFTTSDDWWGLPFETREMIAAYERNFGVRRVTWYSIPNPSLNGMECALVDPNCAAPGVGMSGPIDITSTEAGREVFPYLKPDTGPGGLNLSAFTFGYPATTTVGMDVTPLFLDENGYIAMAIFRPGDGREHLVFSWSSYYPAKPPINIHARVLPYGIINWATRGIFLGERKVYFVPQPDDVFAWGDGWDSDTQTIIVDEKIHRLSPYDLDSLVAWMNDLKTTAPNAADFKIEMPFNGEGTEEDRAGYPGSPLGAVLPGTLTARALELESEFIWLNHTYSHANLNTADYSLSYNEVVKNNDLANFLNLTDYTTTTLLTGAYSGLTNPDVITAAYELGVRYLLADASVVPTYTAPSPNTGIPHPLNPEVLLIPRHANNIYYFAVTPQDETEYYNSVYPDMTRTYEQIIDTITDQSLENLLDFSINPTMFHMNNLIVYTTTQTSTILADFVESLYGKYNALYNDNVPILSLHTQDIGAKMQERMIFDASGASAVWTCGDALTLTATSPARIPVTGIDSPLAVYTETYAGQTISYFDLEAGDSLFIPGAPPSIPEQIGGLTVAVEDTQNVLTWDAVTTDTNGDPVQARYYRVYRDGALLADSLTTATYIDAAPIAGATYTVTAIGDNCWRLASTDSSATPTTLLDFSTSVLAGTVTFTWTTDVETNTAGFNLYISTNPSNPSSWTQVNTETIGVTVGGVYTFTDPNDRRGGTFHYRLEEVETEITGSARVWYPAIAIGIGPNAVSLLGLQAGASSGNILARLGVLTVLAGVVFGIRKRRRVQ